MKTIINTSLIMVVIICIMTCAWLYATGNCPYVASPTPELIMMVNSNFPETTLKTSNFVHRIYENIRASGIYVPLTYIEKIKKIKKIRFDIAIICNRIIMDKHRPVK